MLGFALLSQPPGCHSQSLEAVSPGKFKAKFITGRSALSSAVPLPKHPFYIQVLQSPKLWGKEDLSYVQHFERAQVCWSCACLQLSQEISGSAKAS